VLLSGATSAMVRCGGAGPSCRRTQPSHVGL